MEALSEETRRNRKKARVRPTPNLEIVTRNCIRQAMKRVRPKPPASLESKTRISLRVQPKASKDRVVGKTENGWKIALTAPPVDGKANQACLAFLSKLLHVPRASIRIVRGETSRQKLVEVNGLSLSEVEERFRAQNASDGPER